MKNHVLYDRIGKILSINDGCADQLPPSAYRNPDYIDLRKNEIKRMIDSNRLRNNGNITKLDSKKIKNVGKKTLAEIARWCSANIPKDTDVEIYTALCHGEGWITLTDKDYKKVLLELIGDEISLSYLRVKQ